LEIKIKAVLLQRFKTKQRATKTNVDSVAQLVEHITFNDGVLGSNPSWVTKKKVVRNDSLFLYFEFYAYPFISNVYSPKTNRYLGDFPK
jgi:hypothetical protein